MNQRITYNGIEYQVLDADKVFRTENDAENQGLRIKRNRRIQKRINRAKTPKKTKKYTMSREEIARKNREKIDAVIDDIIADIANGQPVVATCKKYGTSTTSYYKRLEEKGVRVRKYNGVNS